MLGFDVAPRHIDVFSRHSLRAVTEDSLEGKGVAAGLNIGECERMPEYVRTETDVFGFWKIRLNTLKDLLDTACR